MKVRKPRDLRISECEFARTAYEYSDRDKQALIMIENAGWLTLEEARKLYVWLLDAIEWADDHEAWMKERQ